MEYANSSDSKEAQRLLMGRTFDGKFVVATFYPLSAYKRGYLYQIVQWRSGCHVTALSALRRNTGAGCCRGHVSRIAAAIFCMRTSCFSLVTFLQVVNWAAKSTQQHFAPGSCGVSTPLYRCRWIQDSGVCFCFSWSEAQSGRAKVSTRSRITEHLSETLPLIWETFTKVLFDM